MVTFRTLGTISCFVLFYLSHLDLVLHDELPRQNLKLTTYDVQI